MYESNRIVQLSVYIALILISTQTVHCSRLQGEPDLEPDESYEYGPMWPWHPSVQFDRIDDDSRPFDMSERTRFERLHGKPAAEQWIAVSIRFGPVNIPDPNGSNP
ncbi:uncharacterized protein DEA37_0001552 [Paragonimus westermani]|uniref:Uncharacterized protein n=1 Tax=Paragonimus westermani TaxID=34504 RepID=A0A5J4NS26_9TREM|nr:uncharacterized protein DEA37_0001552 [Paragonimus westermani]